MPRLQDDEYTSLGLLRVIDVLERIIADAGLDPDVYADDLHRARKQANQAIRERNRPKEAGEGETS